MSPLFVYLGPYCVRVIGALSLRAAEDRDPSHQNAPGCWRRGAENGFLG